MQSGERAGEAADLIGDHAMTECGVALEVLVGVDHHIVDLRLEAREHVCDHRPAVQQLQTFVDAAHAASEAARENDAAHAAHAKILRVSCGK